MKEKDGFVPQGSHVLPWKSVFCFFRAFLPVFYEWLQISVEKLGGKERELGLDIGDIEGSSPMTKKSRYLKGSRTWCSVRVTQKLLQSTGINQPPRQVKS